MVICVHERVRKPEIMNILYNRLLTINGIMQRLNLEQLLFKSIGLMYLKLKKNWNLQCTFFVSYSNFDVIGEPEWKYALHMVYKINFAPSIKFLTTNDVCKHILYTYIYSKMNIYKLWFEDSSFSHIAISIHLTYIIDLFGEQIGYKIMLTYWIH